VPTIFLKFQEIFLVPFAKDGTFLDMLFHAFYTEKRIFGNISGHESRTAG
jgi:hypothetical protein